MSTAPDPIPLRTLILLMNYERTSTRPVFKEFKLMDSSLVPGSNIIENFQDIKYKIELKSGEKIVTTAGELYCDPRPKSVDKIKIHCYEKRFGPPPPAPNYISRSLSPIHPALDISAEAREDVKNANRNILDLIYQETRNSNGCSVSVQLFKAFVKLCTENQQVSIKLTNENEVFVNIHSHGLKIIEFINPKLFTLFYWKDENGVIPVRMTGGVKRQNHVIIGFENEDDAQDPYVVDMSRMQYGENGRGEHGEIYFLDKLSVWAKKNKKICEKVRDCPIRDEKEMYRVEDNAWLDCCARKVLNRWQRRKEEGWCDYCGIGGPSFGGLELQRCPGCVKNNVWYCCEEHREAGWKLHEYTCEKAKRQRRSS